MTDRWFVANDEHLRIALDPKEIQFVALERNNSGRWVVIAARAPGQFFIVANTSSKRDADRVYEDLCRAIGAPVVAVAQLVS